MTTPSLGPLPSFHWPDRSTLRGTMLCKTCNHTEPHAAAGLGVCLHEECGCDGPIDGVKRDFGFEHVVMQAIAYEDIRVGDAVDIVRVHPGAITQVRKHRMAPLG